MSLSQQRRNIIKTKREIDIFFTKLISSIDSYMECYDDNIMKMAVNEMKTGTNPGHLQYYETLFDKLDELQRRNLQLYETETELHKVFNFLKYRTKYIYSDCKNRIKALNDQISTIIEKIKFIDQIYGYEQDEVDEIFDKYLSESEIQSSLTQYIFRSHSNSDSSSESKQEMKTNMNITINSRQSPITNELGNDNDNSEDEDEDDDYKSYSEDEDEEYDSEEDEEENDQIPNPDYSSPPSDQDILQMMNNYCSVLMQQVIPPKSSKHHKFKTQPCTYFMKYGYCRKEDKCCFSHDANFIKAYYQDSNNIPLKPIEVLFRTKPCRYFFENGFCTKGEHCNFSHDESLRSEYESQKQSFYKKN